VVAGRTGVFGWLRNRTSRLMFWATAARKNCSRTNFNLRTVGNLEDPPGMPRQVSIRYSPVQKAVVPTSPRPAMGEFQ